MFIRYHIKTILFIVVLTIVILGTSLYYYGYLPEQLYISSPPSTCTSNQILLASCDTEDLGEVLSKVRTAVVYITGKRVNSRSQIIDDIMFTPSSLTASDKMGSGLIIDETGYILTNYHVIADTTDLQAKLFNEPERTYPCKVIMTLPDKDLAVIKIHTGYFLPTARLGNSDMQEIADEVLAVGCPFSLEQSVSHGIISDLKRTVKIEGRQYKDLIQTDAVINSGNSGGPLVNMAGEVIGINVAIYAPTRVYCGVGFAIPINQAKLLVMKIQYLKGDS
ncbi:MAG: MamO [Candidatus Magnetoglobus multicellularis str. Araruama]|uniref:MamO n=2 Tax=Candidatus Magnetoglobus multicellularis TaxID=418099 RepID=F4ZYU1_9BACT|nr:MamO [Candidatus Magnetoglobus multicellularis]ETR64737.1 MAG: MamO [Candidatus Magnetoglobus multicellularis str. Araruama]